MNLTVIREDVMSYLGKKVEIQIHGLRNRKTVLHGTIKAVYPNLFVASTEDGEKSFSYADVITKEVIVKYL